MRARPTITVSRVDIHSFLAPGIRSSFAGDVVQPACRWALRPFWFLEDIRGAAGQVVPANGLFAPACGDFCPDGLRQPLDAFVDLLRCLGREVEPQPILSAARIG